MYVVFPLATPFRRIMNAHYNRLLQIISESIGLAFHVCDDELEVYGLGEIFDVFNQTLPTAFVLNTGFWPLFQGPDGQCLCICSRFGLFCRHRKNSNHWIDLSHFPITPSPIIFYPRIHGHVKPSDYTIKLEGCTDVCPGYNLIIDLSLENTRLPKYARNANNRFYFQLCAKYNVRHQFYPQQQSMVLRPNPLRLDSYGKYVRRVNQRQSTDIVPYHHTVTRTEVPDFTLVLDSINLPVYQPPECIQARLFKEKLNPTLRTYPQKETTETGVQTLDDSTEAQLKLLEPVKDCWKFTYDDLKLPILEDSKSLTVAGSTIPLVFNQSSIPIVSSVPTSIISSQILTSSLSNQVSSTGNSIFAPSFVMENTPPGFGNASGFNEVPFALNSLNINDHFLKVTDETIAAASANNFQPTLSQFGSYQNEQCDRSLYVPRCTADLTFSQTPPRFDSFQNDNSRGQMYAPRSSSIGLVDSSGFSNYSSTPDHSYSSSHPTEFPLHANDQRRMPSGYTNITQPSPPRQQRMPWMTNENQKASLPSYSEVFQRGFPPLSRSQTQVAGYKMNSPKLPNNVASAESSAASRPNTPAQASNSRRNSSPFVSPTRRGRRARKNQNTTKRKANEAAPKDGPSSSRPVASTSSQEKEPEQSQPKGSLHFLSPVEGFQSTSTQTSSGQFSTDEEFEMIFEVLRDDIIEDEYIKKGRPVPRNFDLEEYLKPYRPDFCKH